MKAITLFAYFIPETAASLYLFENFIDDLQKVADKVYLLTPTPSRGLTEDVYPYYRKKENRIENKGNLTLHRFPLYREGQKTIPRFIRYFYSCFKYIWHASKLKGYDVMFVESTPPLLGVVGALLKKWKKIPFVYCLQDIFPDSLFITGLANKDGLAWKIGRILENFTYKHADKIIVISEDFKQNIMAKGVPEEKIEVVYNWVDENAVVNVPRKENDLFDKYGISRNKFILSYSGNIGLTQNMDLLLEVMKELQSEQPDIRLVLVGEGAYKKKVEEIIKRDSLTNVSLIPFQPYSDISKVFSLGDVGLVISKSSVGSGCVPSKTWSIMSASRPVLANFDENELKDIVLANECGLFTKAGDKEAFKEAILTLYNKSELCKKMGHNGREFILANLTREIGTSKYVKVLKSVADENE